MYERHRNKFVCPDGRSDPRDEHNLFKKFNQIMEQAIEVHFFILHLSPCYGFNSLIHVQQDLDDNWKTGNVPKESLDVNTFCESKVRSLKMDDLRIVTLVFTDDSTCYFNVFNRWTRQFERIQVMIYQLAS